MKTRHLHHYALFLLLTLLLACCHRKADNEAAPTATPDTVGATPTVADTTVPSPDTVQPSSPTMQKAILQIDSAELTHLRIFGRKQKIIYSPTLLEGEWVLNDWHMQLYSDGRGERWNPKDGLLREEPDRFNWTMDSNLLYMEFKMELGGVIPKMYMVTFVDNESLVYQNAYGEAYMWDRPTASN